MKLDLAKLPMAEAVIGFLLVVLAVTFVAAFSVVNGGGESPPAASPSPAATTPAATPGGSPTPGGPIAVAMRDNFFDPKEITVPAGSEVTFDLTNDGAAIHNMHIAGEGGTFSDTFCKAGGKEPCSDPDIVPAGQKASLEWETPATAGKIDFRCDFHPVEMTGTITVQ